MIWSAWCLQCPQQAKSQAEAAKWVTKLTPVVALLREVAHHPLGSKLPADSQLQIETLLKTLTEKLKEPGSRTMS